MQWVIAIVAVVVLLGGILVAWWVWKKRSQRESRLISLVALLREPISFDPVVLAKTAGKVWNADLGDGAQEGDDGFVVCVGVCNTVVLRNRPYLINCWPRPYVDDPDEAADTIADLRLRQLFREHQAWFSCDALAVDEAASAEEVAGEYQKLAKLFAEFLDENCLMIYLPETRQGYAINDDTMEALESDDPLNALSQTQTPPVVNIGPDNSEMESAAAEAREKWPQFLAAFEARSGADFCIKAPVSYDDVTEFIWIDVTAIEGELIYGTLNNEPANLGPLRLGSKVSVPLSELNDWCYVDPQGEGQGGFTLPVIYRAWQRQAES